MAFVALHRHRSITEQGRDDLPGARLAGGKVDNHDVAAHDLWFHAITGHPRGNEPAALGKLHGHRDRFASLNEIGLTRSEHHINEGDKSDGANVHAARSVAALSGSGKLVNADSKRQCHPPYRVNTWGSR